MKCLNICTDTRNVMLDFDFFFFLRNCSIFKHSNLFNLSQMILPSDRFYLLISLAFTSTFDRIWLNFSLIKNDHTFIGANKNVFIFRHENKLNLHSKKKRTHKTRKRKKKQVFISKNTRPKMTKKKDRINIAFLLNCDVCCCLADMISFQQIAMQQTTDRTNE